MKKSLLVAVALLLSACGSAQGGLDGTYSNGEVSYAFDPEGKVIVTALLGTQREMDYTVEDGKVKIPTPQGAFLMTILDDGAALSFGDDGAALLFEDKKLIKQKEFEQSGLDGTYVESDGSPTFAFEPGGKVVATQRSGTQREMDYIVEDGAVKVQTPKGVYLFTILDDGATLARRGRRLIKQ